MARLLLLPVQPRDGERSRLADDHRLVAALRERRAEAAAALVDGHGAHIRNVVVRVLGPGDPDRADLLQEIFARALQNIDKLSDAGALRAWLTSIAVFTVREHIRRRQRWRFLSFEAEPPDLIHVGASPEVREAVSRVYALLARLPVDERIIFSLRALEGLDLTALASACGVSMSTVRRRLARAEKRFFTWARREPALASWIDDDSVDSEEQGS